jgi:two-component system response regulator YesN
MIRLLIVDDEPIEREAIRLLVSNHFSNIDVVGEAANGFQALQLLYEKKPDLVMMDINMPGIDGMEAIRQMSVSGIRARYIIVTSYNRFEYAKQAIQLGVDDFIVKPAGLQEIRQMLERVQASMERERETLREKTVIDEQLDAIGPTLKSDVVRMLMENEDERDYEKFLSLMSIHAKQLCVVIVDAKDFNTENAERLAVTVEKMGFRVLHENRLKNQHVFIIICESSEREMDAERIGHFMQRRLGNDAGIHAEVFAGHTVKRTEDLAESWVSALDMYLKNRNPAATSGSVFIETAVTEILQKNRQRIRSEVNAFILEHYRKFSEDKGTMRQWLGRVISLIKEKVASRTPYYTYHFDEADQIETTLQDDQPYRIGKIMEQELCDIIHEMELGEASKENPLLQRVEEFLRTRFLQNVALEDLAEFLKVSCPYASRLVKRRMGVSFSECVTKLRIEEAKQLLQVGSLSVKEIAFATGFGSQHYFSRVFKKLTGYAPTDYLWTQQR